MYLNCKTWFSLRYGTIKAERLVELAAEHGVTAMALTNINTTADLWDFVDFCHQKNIKPVAGVEIRNDNAIYVPVACKKQQWIVCNQSVFFAVFATKNSIS